MKFLGMMRVKNEARWIRESIESLLPLCERVFVMNDRSTDDTVEICRSFGDSVIISDTPFTDLNEARDKSWMFEQCAGLAPEWIIMIDGDEVLEKNGPAALKAFTHHPDVHVIALRILYLWNNRNTLRVDNLYTRFYRPSVFRVPKNGGSWACTSFGGNLHCGNVPEQLKNFRRDTTDIALWHYGYFDAELRRRKYDWYNKVDPHNKYEDEYAHIIQGDPGGAPADARLKHAGPLKLQSIEEFQRLRNPLHDHSRKVVHLPE